MSLVGPRALDVEEQHTLEQEIPEFAQRLQIRPGLTGLAQIYDRADEAADKFRFDLEYLAHMGFWLDVRLLFLSVWYTLTARWDRRTGKPSTPSAGVPSVEVPSGDGATGEIDPDVPVTSSRPQSNSDSEDIRL
jgi:hypothetical protein